MSNHDATKSPIYINTINRKNGKNVWKICKVNYSTNNLSPITSFLLPNQLFIVQAEQVCILIYTE